MVRFKKMGPPLFKGESDPDIAESWIRVTEKIFSAIRCPEEDKVVVATFTLQEMADDWWSSIRRTTFAGREDISWGSFLECSGRSSFQSISRIRKSGSFWILPREICQ